MWEELYEDYFKELVSYGTRMCGSRELSEDLAQETFIKAMMHAAAIEDLSPPSGGHGCTVLSKTSSSTAIGGPFWKTTT